MRWTLCTVVLLFVLGCGGGTSKVKLSGTVTLDAAPLPEGIILFEDAEGKKGKEMAVVRDGKYEVHLPPGPRIVRITCERVAPGKTGAMNMPLIEQIIPEKYNKASQLRITAGESKVENFTLQTKEG